MTLSEANQSIEKLNDLRLLQSDKESEQTLDTAIERLTTQIKEPDSEQLLQLYNIRKFFRELQEVK